MVLFYIFFEFTLIPLFFIIGLWGGPQRRRAAVTFFLYTLAGSLLTLLGVISLVMVHYQHTAANVLTFSIPELTAGLAALDWPLLEKRGLVGKPAGGDFPAASGGVCDQGSALSVSHLAAAGPRRGADGRVDLAGGCAAQGWDLRADPVQPGHDAARVGIALWAHGNAVGDRDHLRGIGGAAQTDVKRLVAYSSVSHMGFIVLGIFTLNSTALDGRRFRC